MAVGLPVAERGLLRRRRGIGGVAAAAPAPGRCLGDGGGVVGRGGAHRGDDGERRIPLGTGSFPLSGGGRGFAGGIAPACCFLRGAGGACPAGRKPVANWGGRGAERCLSRGLERSGSLCGGLGGAGGGRASAPGGSVDPGTAGDARLAAGDQRSHPARAARRGAGDRRRRRGALRLAAAAAVVGAGAGGGTRRRSPARSGSTAGPTRRGALGG